MSFAKLYLYHALLDAPPQEHAMKRPAWLFYQATILRTLVLDRQKSTWEMPRLLLIVMLALNTWIIIGLLGMLFGPGFWAGIWHWIKLMAIGYAILFGFALIRHAWWRWNHA